MDERIKFIARTQDGEKMVMPTLTKTGLTGNQGATNSDLRLIVKTPIYPFILSGGSGARLWPLSRRAYPKQFLKLVSEQSLIQQTCLRLGNPVFAAPVVLGNHEHRFIVAEQLAEIGVTPSAIVLEPAARNTAPAAIIAALMTARKDQESLILLLPSDHVITNNESFTKSVKSGMEAARNGQIVTFGVPPDSPETGYGYIQTAQGKTDIKDVIRFVEKPDEQKAKAYLEDGNYFWNAGIFLFSAKGLISAFEQHAPNILQACIEALDKSVEDLDFLRLDKAAYESCRSASLDYAIMEKANNITCIPLKTQWSDLGAWSSIWQVMEKDAQGNAANGNVILHKTNNSFAHSKDGACLALIGLDNVMVIATKDGILVAAKDKVQDVKHIVDQLNAEKRGLTNYHSRVYRPWGWYEGLDVGQRYQVKSLMVKPGAKLSLQSHHYRAEHWVVVSGTVEVTLDDKTFLLSENESTYIPIGTKHRLANPGKLPALLIEVQSGPYLAEDDIVRFEDDYGRNL